MAYKVNDKVYSDHALMDEIIYHTKKIIKDIVIKNRRLADSYETKQSVEESNVYMAILDDDIDIYTYPFTEALLMEYGYDKYDARYYASNRDAIPKEEREELLTWACVKYLTEYDEKNFYYRMLNGMPKYGTTEYDIYLDPNNPKLAEDDCNTDFPWTDSEGNRVPIHKFNTDQVNTLEALGILDDYKAEHKGDENYRYLEHLTLKNISIYQARKADEWEILYIPKVEYLVRSRFAELYYINRQIYYRNFNQLAFTFNQDYFEELTIAIIVAQTLADMIVDVPEWYIRRDIFDLRSCQYFLDSHGVKYFKKIPLKYQIRIVKNINKLIRYKSTNKNMWDIINLFNADNDVIVYKYYLLRDWAGRVLVEPEPEEKQWEMDDEYDFLTEEKYEEVLEPGDYERDFGDEEVDDFSFKNGIYVYEFGYAEGYMDPGTILNPSYFEPTHIEWDMEDEYEYGDEEYDNILINRDEVDDFGNMGKDDFLFDKGAYYYDFGHEIDEVEYEDFDFYDEDQDPEVPSETLFDAVILDFGNENDWDIVYDTTKTPLMYDFGNIDSNDLPDVAYTMWREDYLASTETIIDEYRNIYSLEFIKVPIGDNYDDYIKNNMYRVDYDTITMEDKYWTGEDTHYYIKNQHMDKDFTVEGTKYMGLEFTASMQEYQAQIPYFLGMVFQTTVEIGDIRVELPMVGTGSYTLTDIFIFLQCISAAFYNRTQMIHLPDMIGDYKPAYENYPIDIDGGHAWTKDIPKPEPELKDIEDVWIIPNLDFGEEEKDNIGPDVVPPEPESEEEVITEEDEVDYNTTIAEEDIEELLEEPESEINMYEFEDDEDYNFIYETDEDPDIYDIKKLYDYNTVYQIAEREILDETDEKGRYHTVYETLLVPANKEMFIPEDQDFGEEDDEHWNLPQGNRLAGIDVIDFGYHSDARADQVDDWDYGREYPYIEYIIEIRKPIEDEGAWNFWDDLEPEYYEIDIDGNPIELTERTMLNIDGGKDEWSIVTHETFYDWLRWDNPQQFISESNRIYGFNLNADMGELADNVGVRHSNFGFTRGYTLEDLGIADFIAMDEISDINDLLEIYQTNIKCYWNLRHILENPNSRDEFVTAQYAFMYLFTKDFDREFYRLKCGDMATSLPEILQERSLGLYKYYNKLLTEPDLNIKQDFIRYAINDISNTLEYYVKGDNLRYIFEWVPTYSFEALIDYINLMIDFFKSWKVYLVNPAVVYDIQDKVNNRTIIADQMVSVKETKQVYDNDEERDVVTKILQISTIEEENASYCQEVIDGYKYFVRDPSSPLEYDGGNPGTEVIITPIEEDMEWNDSDLDGGDISDGPSATYNVDGGTAGARMYLNDIDGGGPMDLMIDPIDFNGKDITEPDGPVVMDNSYNIIDREIDGGGPSPTVFSTKTAIVSAKKQILTTEVRLSNYRNNAIEIREDGLYIYGDPEMYGYEYFGEDIPFDQISIYDYGDEPDYAIDTFIPPDLDFGDEEVDDISGDPLSVDYDFAYHADMDGEKMIFDYNIEERVPDSELAYNIDLGDEDRLPDEEGEVDYSFNTPSLDFGYEGKDYIHGDPLSLAYDFDYNAGNEDAIKVYYDYGIVTDREEWEDYSDFNQYTNDSLDFGYMADDTERYEYFKRIFSADKVNYGNVLKTYYTTVMVLSDPMYVPNYTKTYARKYMSHAEQLIEDLTSTRFSENKMRRAIDLKAEEFVDHVKEVSPLSWKDFSTVV